MGWGSPPTPPPSLFVLFGAFQFSCTNYYFVFYNPHRSSQRLIIRLEQVYTVFSVISEKIVFSALTGRWNFVDSFHHNEPSAYTNTIAHDS